MEHVLASLPIVWEISKSTLIVKNECIPWHAFYGTNENEWKKTEQVPILLPRAARVETGYTFDKADTSQLGKSGTFNE